MATKKMDPDLFRLLVKAFKPGVMFLFPVEGDLDLIIRLEDVDPRSYDNTTDPTAEQVLRIRYSPIIFNHQFNLVNGGISHRGQLSLPSFIIEYAVELFDQPNGLLTSTPAQFEHSFHLDHNS